MLTTLARVPTFGMEQRSDHGDFYIRDKQARRATTTPHRHGYFQIQINLGGDTVAIADAPELAPFRFQEHLDFVLGAADFNALQRLLDEMRALDRARHLGSGLLLKGLLLQLIGSVNNLYQPQLLALAAGKAQQRGRRDALGRVAAYIREHIADPALNVTDAAAAAFVTPNYLTHMLRKEAGSNFSDLVLERRMRLARTHLMNSAKPVSRIAWLCGFADEAYFSRRFRRAHGMPPGHSDDNSKTRRVRSAGYVRHAPQRNTWRA